MGSSATDCGLPFLLRLLIVCSGAVEAEDIYSLLRIVQAVSPFVLLHPVCPSQSSRPQYPLALAIMSRFYESARAFPHLPGIQKSLVESIVSLGTLLTTFDVGAFVDWLSCRLREVAGAHAVSALCCSTG